MFKYSLNIQELYSILILILNLDKPDYMVLCNSLKLAKSWLLEYKAATSNDAKPRIEQQQLPKIISVSGSGQSSESTGDHKLNSTT